MADAFAQNYLDFSELKKYKSSYKFDKSWEYLTTEIYPYNFQYLPNTFEQKVRKNLQSLYIYAKIRGGEYNKIEYPLYYYQTKNKTLNIRTADKVTLFKGLSIKNEDEIDADVTINGITEKNKFMEIITDQMSLIADIKNPMLIPKLMERFNEYKDKFTKGYEYSFTKTISAFEKTTDRRIHSLSIYYINAYDGSANMPKLMPNTIQADINANKEIDNEYLQSVMPATDIPYVVIINYLSQGEQAKTPSAAQNTSDPGKKTTPAQPGKFDTKDEVLINKTISSTEKIWKEKIWSDNQLPVKNHTTPRLVLMEETSNTACGKASSMMYCSGDQKIYMNTKHLESLKEQLKANSGLALAYITAYQSARHEVYEMGYMYLTRQAKSEAYINEVNERIELLGNYLAGVWAHHECPSQYNGLSEDEIYEMFITTGNILNGDKQFSAPVNKRIKWFRKGLENGTPKHIADIIAGAYNNL